MTPRFLLVLWLLLLCACGTPTRTARLSDLDRLPESEGAFGGKVYIGTPWKYYGSDLDYHYLLYAYTRENSAHWIRIKLARSDLSLGFQFPFSTYSGKYFSVAPVVTFGRIYGFVQSTDSKPREIDWKSAKDSSETYDKEPNSKH